MMRYKYVYLLVATLTLTLITGSDLSILDSVYNTWNAGYCKLTECCHEDDGSGHIQYGRGIEELALDLKMKVHGQPLVFEPIFRSLMAHVNNQRPSRPLVMYFSGWTGTGKTYVAQMIAKNLYSKGMDSKFVRYISSSFHFPMKIENEREIDVQRRRLREMIRDTVTKCERSLIILDELDKLPAGVVDALQPMFNYVESLDGTRYNKAIFIFLSNTGATKLNALSYKLYGEGKERNDLRRKDIEEILISESFDEQGGLRRSEFLRRYSIGVFVPFLPLERKHVSLCIKDIIAQFYREEKENAKIIDEVADEMTYFPEDIQMYSKSGCKGVYEKVVNHLGPPKMKQEEL